MKKLLLLLVFTLSNVLFSQTEAKKFKDKFAEFDYYAKPDKTNDLSKYFKRNIEYTLLENYKFKDTLRKNSAVNLSFKLDKSQQIIDLVVNSPYSELNFVIKKAFETYDLRTITIPDYSPLNLYTLQILSRDGNKMVVNCSSYIVYDRFPVFEGCAASSTYAENRLCFTELLEQHLAKNISVDFVKKRKLLGTFFLVPEFIITENGTVEKVNWKTASDSLTLETNRIMALFPVAKTPATRNGNPSRMYIKEAIELEIQSKNEDYIENVQKSKDSTLNANSELALHFKQFITAAEIGKYKLPATESKGTINFSLDKKGNIVNTKSNVKNKELDEKLLAIFKKFPIEKLNIKQPNVLDVYYYNIFTIEYDNKIIIHCNENPNMFSEAYFDQKCEKSNSQQDLRFCFQEKMTNQIVKNFDSSLIMPNDIANGLRLVFIIQVDVDGTLTRINAMNTNPKYSNELDRIIKIMPKVYRPAYWKGKPIITTYAIPISF